MVKDKALNDFEAARRAWDAAFAQAPDEALTYLKPGDDYALGGLQVHVNWVLVHYRRILDGLIDRDFASLEPLDPPVRAPRRLGVHFDDPIDDVHDPVDGYPAAGIDF